MLPAMGSPELQRKVRQHDNELLAVYDILNGHSDDLTEIKATLAEHGSTLAEHGVKLDDQGAKLTAVDSKLDQLSSTVGEQGAKLDELLTLMRNRSGESSAEDAPPV